MDEPALYCGTYAKYNNGSIAGKWLRLRKYKTAEEFLQACKELHKDEDDPEFMFQDYEHMPRQFYGESLSSRDLEKLYEWVNLDEDDRALVQEYAEACGYSLEDIDIEQARDSYFTTLQARSDDGQAREVGQYALDNGLLGATVPDALENYIDTEAIGRDWLFDLTVSSNGYVFTNY
jgi:antirestriction protein